MPTRSTVPTPWQIGYKKSPERMAKFVYTMAHGGSVRQACEAAGIVIATAYKWRREDAEFAERWAMAQVESMDRAEEELRRRAVQGVLEPVYQQGRKVGTIRKYSDNLLLALMKGRRGEVYNTDRLEVTGEGGGPVRIEQVRRIIVDPIKDVT